MKEPGAKQPPVSLGDRFTFMSSEKTEGCCFVPIARSLQINNSTMFDRCDIQRGRRPTDSCFLLATIQHATGHGREATSLWLGRYAGSTEIHDTIHLADACVINLLVVVAKMSDI